MRQTLYAGVLALAGLASFCVPGAARQPLRLEVETLQPPAPVAARVPTAEEFAAHFKPQPGAYEVTLLHPKTGCPVKVCFSLPQGCPRSVKVTRHVLAFDYGRCSVRIRFLHNGQVKVLN